METKMPRQDQPIKQLSNGKWVHPLDREGWDDLTACETDYRFALEYQRCQLVD